MAGEHSTLRGTPQGVPQRSGQQVGRYEILSHIASGGMGAVYLAFDPILSRRVALKVLSPEMAARPNMVERFQREAKAAAKLKHENIVGIYDFGEAAGTLYLALEFVDGTDLQDYVEQQPGGRLDVADTIAVAIQAAKALDHAFGQGIVHRDIKPSNFLVTTRGGKLFVKLTDLGLAREAEDARITRDNTTLGTVDYISPEQARDAGAADSRSDIYSLGCTIYHVLVGHPPFPKGGLIEKIQQHLATPAPDVRNHRSDVSDHLSDVIYKMLAKDPAERYETPLHLLHDLMAKDEFDAYVANAKEAPRGEFRPPVHYPRRVEPTVFLAPEDLPDPEPLFPTDFRVTDDTDDEICTAAGGVADDTAIETPAMKEAVESVELEPFEEPPPPQPKKRTALKIGPAAEPPRPKSDRPTPRPPTKAKRPTARPAKAKPAAVKQRARRLEKRRMRRLPLWVGGIAGGLLLAAFVTWAMVATFQPRRDATPKTVEETPAPKVEAAKHTPPPN